MIKLTQKEPEVDRRHGPVMGLRDSYLIIGAGLGRGDLPNRERQP